MNKEKRKDIDNYVRKLEEIQFCLNLLSNKENPQVCQNIKIAISSIDEAITNLYQARGGILK